MRVPETRSSHSRLHWSYNLLLLHLQIHSATIYGMGLILKWRLIRLKAIKADERGVINCNIDTAWPRPREVIVGTHENIRHLRSWIHVCWETIRSYPTLISKVAWNVAMKTYLSQVIKHLHSLWIYTLHDINQASNLSTCECNMNVVHLDLQFLSRLTLLRFVPIRIVDVCNIRCLNDTTSFFYYCWT